MSAAFPVACEQMHLQFVEVLESRYHGNKNSKAENDWSVRTRFLSVGKFAARAALSKRESLFHFQV